MTDWVVFKSYGSWNIFKVDKVTEQMVFCGGHRRIARSDVKFQGDEETAHKLFSKLISSGALCRQEQNAAAERRFKRDEAIISTASAVIPA